MVLGKLNIFKGIKGKLARSHNAIAGAVEGAFKGVSREEALEQIEEALILSDVGIKTAMEITDNLREGFGKWDMETVKARLREDLYDILKEVEAPLELTALPHVIMVLGVNGVGKTTTIGKLASRFTDLRAKALLLAAGDTFRAAAMASNSNFGPDVAGASIIKQAEGGDPGAVAFDAMKSAMAQRYRRRACSIRQARLHTKDHT